MQAVRIHEYGGVDVLQGDEIERPEPNANKVLIEVAAAGVNPVDIHVREGYRATPEELNDVPGPVHRGLATPAELPRILGADVAGVVRAVGTEVNRFQVGDRVFGTGLHNDRLGSYTEYTVARTDRLAHLPPNVPFEVGGAVGAVAATAWRALIHHGGLVANDGCLVHGATGGLGHVAVQIADHAGARVVGTARPAVHDQVREFGALAAVDYDSPDMADEVRQALNGGPDVILDHMAGALLDLDVDIAGFGARIVIVGGPQDECAISEVRSAMQKDITVKLIGVSNTPTISDLLEPVAHLLERGCLDVVIHETYHLTEAAQAHQALEENQFVGKLVVTP
jgi:NADPH:quinone reductase-like Zn-dependent oxidoreductase